ncbi:MAG: hypothetical protein RL375_4510 [Pseudomonadota bacterium]|jgi:hypothetical protein
MTRSTMARVLAAAAFVTAALGAASAAQANPSVVVTIGLPFPQVRIDAPPVYLPPAPVVMTPRVVYAQPQVIVVERPARGWQEIRYGRDADERGWRHGEWRRHHHGRHGHHDRDDDRRRGHDRHDD